MCMATAGKHVIMRKNRLLTWLWSGKRPDTEQIPLPAWALDHVVLFISVTKTAEVSASVDLRPIPNSVICLFMFSESVAPSQCLFGADVFIKTLPEWSHLNVSGGVLIMSQFLFCISSSETVYLTIKALTFSICETSARNLWMCSVRSFLLSRFPFFSPHFLSFFNLLLFLPGFHISPPSLLFSSHPPLFPPS